MVSYHLPLQKLIKTHLPMKHFHVLLLAIAVAASCAKTPEEVLPTCKIYPLDHYTENADIRVFIGSYNYFSFTVSLAADPNDKWDSAWETLHKTSATVEAMEKSISAGIGSSNAEYMEKGIEVAYGKIISPVSIKASIEIGGRAPGEELNDLFDVIPVADISFPAMEVAKLYGSDEKVVSSAFFKDGTAWHQPGGAGLAFRPRVKIQFPYSGDGSAIRSCDVTLTVDFSLDGYDRNMSPSTLHVHREYTFTAYEGM